MEKNKGGLSAGRAVGFSSLIVEREREIQILMQAILLWRNLMKLENHSKQNFQKTSAQKKRRKISKNVGSNYKVSI
jgi:hypothetical protein